MRIQVKLCLSCFIGKLCRNYFLCQVDIKRFWIVHQLWAFEILSLWKSEPNQTNLRIVVLYTLFIQAHINWIISLAAQCGPLNVSSNLKRCFEWLQVWTRCPCGGGSVKETRFKISCHCPFKVTKRVGQIWLWFVGQAGSNVIWALGLAET
jgi:hypothetical protein